MAGPLTRTAHLLRTYPRVLGLTVDRRGPDQSEDKSMEIHDDDDPPTPPAQPRRQFKVLDVGPLALRLDSDEPSCRVNSVVTELPVSTSIACGRGPASESVCQPSHWT